MKKTSLLLIAFTMLFISFIYAQPAPPILLFPADEAMNLPVQDLILQFDQPGWQVESFFDIYFSPEPLNPLEPDSTALIYHGPLAPGGRTILEYHIAALLAEQTYYWFVRYSNFVDYWVSQVSQFTTGTYVIPSSTISGKVLYPSPPGGFVAGNTVTVAANGIVIGKAYSSGIDGSYSFNMANSTTVTYYVTPVPPSAIKYFSPTFYSYSNLSQDQLNQDFYLMTYTPYGAINPVPYNLATGVSINIGQLQWTYREQFGYGTPTGFEVYFPADNPVPVIVPYIADRDSLYDHPIGPLLPGTEYNWKIIPFNQYGPYELQDTWWYVTDIIVDPSQPYLIDPPMFADDFEDGTCDAWSFEMPRNRPIEDCIFDVYMDTDSTFTAPPNYTGDGHPDPANPGYYWSIATNLDYGTHYYWKVKVTDTSSGLSNESEVWEFNTRTDPSPPTLVAPPDNATDILVQDVELSFNVVNYNIDSFFDIFCDIDSLFPNPVLYSGPLTQQRPVWFTYDLPPLQPNQVYYWRVKYHNLAEEYITESDIYQFTTGNYVVPSSTISGTISSSHNVSAVKVTCLQACVPNSVNTGIAGTYSFTVNNGLNPVVVPAKQGYYFSPAMDSVNNIQSNHVSNFTMNSIYPNSAIQPIPAHLATDVSINIGQLQWTYIQLPYYSPPTGFEVYFPASATEPYAIVSYARDSLFTVTIPPLEYDMPYEWKVVPVNEDGWAEYMELWSFETEPYPEFPPTPLYVYPSDHQADVKDAGLVMYWGPPPGREEFPVESFFDVFCEIDSVFDLPPIYSGPARVDSLNPANRLCYAPLLSLDTTYYWKVRVTDLSNSLSSESDIWDFTTQDEHIPLPAPVLVNPCDWMDNVPPFGVDLEWDWIVNGFYDITYDIDPGFSNPNVVWGYWDILRTILQCHISNLMTEQTYYWYVRYTNFADHWYSQSPVWSFTTGSYIPSDVIISHDGTISWAEVPGVENYNIYRSDNPYGPFSLVGTTLNLWWLDPALPGTAAFYYVTSVIPEPARK